MGCVRTSEYYTCTLLDSHEISKNVIFSASDHKKRCFYDINA